MEGPCVINGVLVSKDALQILQHRSELGRDAKVHISGTVKCLSAIIKVKDARLFMVQLDSGLNIIIKKDCKLAWYDQLQIGKMYVFTHMVPTSLQQGGQKQHAVFAVKDKSALYSTDDVSINTVSAADWMSRYARSGDLGSDKQQDLTSASFTSRDVERNSLFSYEGQVSAVMDREMGIYELDGSVRLYVGLVPAVHKFAMIGEGSCLSIQNAHSSQQAGRKVIYCCMLTTISVVAHPLDQVQSASALGKPLQRLLYLSRLSSSQLDFLGDLRAHLTQALQPLFGHRTREKICSILLQDASLAGVPSGDPARNLLDEFLAFPHSCGLTAISHKIPLPLALVGDIIRQQLPPLGDENEEIGSWSYTSCLNTQQMLVGRLDSCKDSGSAFIEDGTGRLDIVCCKHGDGGSPASSAQHLDTTLSAVDMAGSNDDSSNQEKCSEQCHCTVLKPGAPFPCHFLHSCCLGNVVLVKKYEIVSESCQQHYRMGRQGNTGCHRNVNSLNSRQYLLVNMTDVHCLICNSTKPQERSRDSLQNALKTSTKQSEKRKLNDITNEDTMEHSHLNEGQPRHKRDSVIGSTDLTTTVSNGTDALERKSCATSKIKDIRQVCLLREVTIYVETIGSVVTGGNSGDGCVDSQFFLEADIRAGDRIFKVCLAFRGGLVRFYPVICPGHSYTLSLDEGELAALLSMNVANTQIQRAAIKSKTRILLLVHEKAEVKEHWTDQTPGRQRLTELTNILDHSYVGTFVSFKGKVLQRMYCSKEGDTSVARVGPFTRIEVQDLENADLKLWVYMDERDVPCHPGLIPGAQVLWITLERKLGRPPGCDTVYCRLVPFSSVRLMRYEDIRGCPMDYEEEDIDAVISKLPESALDLQPGHAPSNNMPHLRLDDLFTRQSDLNLFTCVCDVLSILNLTLQVKCKHCNSLMAHGKCDNGSCDNTDSYSFYTRATLLVDDGTAIARVKVKGPCVRTVLNLTPDQWAALETEVWRCREVFFQKVKLVRETWLDRFACHMCESQTVHQSLMLTCRVAMLPNIHQMAKSEFSVKEMDLASNRMKTRYIPIPHLDCLDLEKFDAARFILRNIAK